MKANDFHEAAQMPASMKEANLEDAKRVYRNMVRRLNRCRIKATRGDKAAASNLIVLMTELNVKLRELGYRRSESENSSKLAQITQEWIDRVEASKSEVDKLRDIATKTNSQEDVARFIHALASEISTRNH